MRVVVVTTSYPSAEGDPAGHFVHEEVQELESAGHTVTVVRPEPGGAFGWPGVASRLREKPLRTLPAAAWVARAAFDVRAARPDRVIAHWCVPSAFPIALMGSAGVRGAEGAEIELEIVSHGADVRLLAAMPPRARTAIVKRLTAKASRWRFVSETLLETLTASLPTESKSALTRIATIGASPLAVVDVRAEAEARRASLAGRRIYVCAARLVPSKRIDKVIDYVASSRRGESSVLVVLGDGPERPRLEHLARRWLLDARFLGMCPRPETLAWIGAADELVHASHAEGLSSVVREAEQLGVKVTLL